MGTGDRDIAGQRQGDGQPRECRHPGRKAAMEGESFPAVVILGWKQPNPGLEVVRDITKVLGVEVWPRMVRAIPNQREHLIKVLVRRGQTAGAEEQVSAARYEICSTVH